jgi:hypothetical protein
MVEPTAEPDARLYAPATQRSRIPILAVLRKFLPATGLVLEIASGTGEHSTYFAPHFPALTWQPSDPAPESLASIVSWRAHSATPNLLPPLLLDARSPIWPLDQCAAMVCINMLHIAPWSATLGLLAGAQKLLPSGGLLYVYGPFRQTGQPTAPSNEAFEAMLQGQDPAWGLRDLDQVTTAAQACQLRRSAVIPMPANNLSLVFYRD